MENLFEKYSWVEIIDIDSGRMTITMKGLKRDEFGVNEIRKGREREKKSFVQIKLFSSRNELWFLNQNRVGRR